jgi:phage gp36-like protein
MHSSENVKKKLLIFLTRCLQHSRSMLEKQLFLQPQLASRREQSPNRKYQSRRDSVKVPRSLYKVSAIFTQSACYLNTKYLLSLHKVPAIFTQSVCYLYTKCLLSLHKVSAIFTQSACYLYTKCLLSLHKVSAIFTQSACYLYTKCLLCLHEFNRKQKFVYHISKNSKYGIS